MAKIETAHIANFTINHANICSPVGVGEKNKKDDVMMIQTLFKLISYNQGNADEFFGVVANKLPEPTGNLDDKTMLALSIFQLRKSNRLFRIDGKIHPASYKNRHIKRLDGVIMAITLLNLYVVDGMLAKYPGKTLKEAIKLEAPSIVFSC